ncbi:MAG: ACP S-malonyltransferase [Syntrophales bacterium]|jgi:[acyl-carrier-protein] S-malonyltransferase|nr:ACP S-malonyltransferase [Syntrophales bacterium]MCK9527603.1 ACP S-malonyltransferase [Syntrophales bacterium]MDX9922220.1 ACP S-malonyltransferase [Syntrophales bacterium]
MAVGIVNNQKSFHEIRPVTFPFRTGHVFMFAGQGAQYVGMGRKLHDVYPRAREIFQLAEDLSGKNIAEICFKGPITALVAADTVQIALTTVNIASFEFLINNLGTNKKGNVYLGHSVGEYAALYASGVLSLEDTLKAVVYRGAAMLSASRKISGCMYAINGIKRRDIEDAIYKAGLQKSVFLACDNSPREQVIAGEEKSARELIAHLASSEKYFRFTRLPVAGAWHSPLMRRCTEEFRQRIMNITLHRPHSHVVMNYSGCAEYSQSRIRENMICQLFSPVRWRESIQYLLRTKHNIFYEIGPKRVLAVFLEDIAAGVHRYACTQACIA